MRITDVIFFGSMILAFIAVLIFKNAPITEIWLGILTTIAISKMTIPKSKFVKWLEKERW